VVSFLDLVAFGVQTGYRVQVQCDRHKQPRDVWSMFADSIPLVNRMQTVSVKCSMCQQFAPSHYDDVVDQQPKRMEWSMTHKVELTQALLLQCKLTPKDDASNEHDLDNAALLQLLGEMNASASGGAASTLDLEALRRDIEQYEAVRQSRSIGVYCSRQVREWCDQYAQRPLSQRREHYHELAAVLSQAIFLWTGQKYYPRTTQMIPMFIAIHHELSPSRSQSKGVLFEIRTGEGKSVVVMLMAAMQKLLFDSKVDVATSQTLLAEREAHETREFFSMVGVGEARYIDQDDKKEARRDCYRAAVIYSTAYSYECDLLHRSSGKRQEIDCREARPTFETIVIDEVDNSLIDLALSSTQLSSPTPGYREINKVLFLICSRMRLAVATLGDVFVIDRVMYWSPSDCPNIINEYEANILAKVEDAQSFADVVATRIVEYCADNADNGLQLLQRYGFRVSGAMRYETLVQQVNALKYRDPKRFLQLLSQSGILRISTLIMSKRFDAATKQMTLDFCCHFQDGEVIYDAVDVSSYKGFIAVAESSQTGGQRVDWHNMRSIMKCEHDTFIQQIKHNVRATVVDYVGKISGSFPQFVRRVIDKRLDVWIDSCWRALYQLHEGKDYIIDRKNNKILVVDFENTGCVQHKMHWSHGVHEFIQIKHGFKMSTISTAANIMTNSCFFGMYGKLYGLSGTLGGDKEAQYFQKCFNVDIVRIPSFRPYALVQNRNIYCNNHSEWLQTIVLAAFAKLQQGCAVLIIAQHIKQVEVIERQLKAQNGRFGMCMKRCFKYSRQDTDEKDVIGAHKLDMGDVIVATNLAGRGTDIKLTDKVNANGGLGVILTFMASNIRIEKQAVGRTARAGNPGASAIIVNKQTCDYVVDGAANEVISRVRDLVSAQQMEQLETRVCSKRRIEDFYRRFKEFMRTRLPSSLNDHDKDQIYYRWALAYTRLEDDNNSDDDLRRIYGEFEQSVARDLSCDSGYYSLSIAYNPHYLTVNGICHDDEKYAKRLLNEAARILGHQHQGIVYYFRAANAIRLNDTAISEACTHLGTAIQSFAENLKRAQELYALTSSDAGLQRKLGFSSSSSMVAFSSRGSLSGQSQFEMKYWKCIIELAQSNMEELQKAGKKAKVKYERIDSAIDDIDDYTEYTDCVVNYYKQCGLWMRLEFEAKRTFWDRCKGFFMALIGGLTAVAGAFCCLVPGLSSLGTSLIMSGIQAVIEGVTAMITGQCGDFGEWFKNFAIKVGMAALCAGIGAAVSEIASIAAKLIPQKLVDIAKTVIKGVKDLGDKGFLQKIKNGDFKFADVLDVAGAFVPGDSDLGGDIKKCVDVGKTAVHYVDAVAKGGDVFDATLNAFGGIAGAVGNGEAKEFTGQVAKYGKLGKRVVTGVASGNVEGIVDSAMDISSEFVSDSNAKKVMNTAASGVKMTHRLVKSNGQNGLDELDSFGSELVDSYADADGAFRNGYARARKHVKTAINVGQGIAQNGVGSSHEALALASDLVDDFGDEKLQQATGSVVKYARMGTGVAKHVARGNVKGIVRSGSNIGSSLIHDYAGDDFKGMMDGVVGSAANIATSVKNAVDFCVDFDDAKSVENAIAQMRQSSKAFGNYVSSASAAVSSHAVLEQGIKSIQSRLEAQIMNGIRESVTAALANSAKFKVSCLLLFRQKLLNNADATLQKIQSKFNIKGNDEFHFVIVQVQLADLYEKNAALQKHLDALQRVLSRAGMKKSATTDLAAAVQQMTQVIFGSAVMGNIKQHIEACFEAVRELITRTSQVDEQMKKIKESNPRVNVTMKDLCDLLSKDKDMHIPNNFATEIVAILQPIMMKSVFPIVEALLVNSFGAQRSAMHGLDPASILNDLTSSSLKKNHFSSSILT